MELLMFGLQRIPSRWHVLEVRRALGLSDVQFCVGFFSPHGRQPLRQADRH